MFTLAMFVQKIGGRMLVVLQAGDFSVEGIVPLLRQQLLQLSYQLWHNPETVFLKQSMEV